MRTALVISLLTHGLAMTVHFTSPEPPKPTAQEIGMEVILVNAGTKSAPAKADVLAQVNSDGGGNSERGRAAAPVPRSAATSDGEMLASVQQQQAQLEAQQRLLAAEVEAQKQHVVGPRPRGPMGCRPSSRWMRRRGPTS
jgi:protein TonB